MHTVYRPAVHHNTVIADTGNTHKLHSIMPKNLAQTSFMLCYFLTVLRRAETRTEAERVTKRAETIASMD